MKNEKIYTIESGDTTVEFSYSSSNDQYPLLATRLKLRGEIFKDVSNLTEEKAEYWQKWLQIRDIRAEVFKHFGNYRLMILEAMK